MPVEKRESGLIRIRLKYLLEMIGKSQDKDGRLRLLHIFSDYDRDAEIVVEISDKTDR